ncbi:hypothetical protein [Coleofasciculus sp.]|uniref:hypothetical protein n=1 Tax=Coleofasciculus sp. TaxID=3100458 RepID=UPI0039F79D27
MAPLGVGAGFTDNISEKTLNLTRTRPDLIRFIHQRYHRSWAKHLGIIFWTSIIR